MAQPLILVVDDAPDIILFIETVLEEDYRIITASNGRSALELATVHLPDIILLDVQMPGISGYETCMELKSNSKTSRIPIIMVSGMSEEGDELVGLQAGAVDYITKPISIAILQARIHNQLLLLDTRRDLENAHLEISSERKYIEEIIDKMRNAYEFNHKHVRYASRSPELNSGDLVLSIMLSDGCQLVLVADFTGHGLPAAIGSPLVSYIFHKNVSNNVHPTEIIAEMNNTLKRSFPTNIFVAATIIEISPDRTQASLWNFGMEDILLLSPDQSWQHFSSKNCALGIINNLNTSAHYSIPIEPGQYLYLFTDGVTEASDQSLKQEQKMFGIKSLKQVLQLSLQKDIGLDVILDQILLYANSPKDFDDMTILELSIS